MFLVHNCSIDFCFSILKQYLRIFTDIFFIYKFKSIGHGDGSTAMEQKSARI